MAKTYIKVAERRREAGSAHQGTPGAGAAFARATGHLPVAEQAKAARAAATRERTAATAARAAGRWTDATAHERNARNIEATAERARGRQSLSMGQPRGARQSQVERIAASVKHVADETPKMARAAAKELRTHLASLRSMQATQNTPQLPEDRAYMRAAASEAARLAKGDLSAPTMSMAKAGETPKQAIARLMLDEQRVSAYMRGTFAASQVSPDKPEATAAQIALQGERYYAKGRGSSANYQRQTIERDMARTSEAKKTAKAASGKKATTEREASTYGTKAYHQAEAKSWRQAVAEEKATPRAWRDIQIAPKQAQSKLSKLSPAEHEARQSEPVRRAEAGILRTYTALRDAQMAHGLASSEKGAGVTGGSAKERTARQALVNAQAALNTAVSAKEAAVKDAYAKAGLKYTAPKNARQAKADNAAKAETNRRATQAKQLYTAAKNEDATFKARQQALIAEARWDRLVQNAKPIARQSLADMQKDRRLAVQTARYNTNWEGKQVLRTPAWKDKSGLGSWTRETNRNAAATARRGIKYETQRLAEAKKGAAGQQKAIASARAVADAAKANVARTQHADWLRLLGENGLGEFSNSIKAPK